MFIGSVKIEPPLILAPMAGVTDRAFRVLVKEKGCGLLVSEMVSSKGLLYKNKKTTVMLGFSEEERPFAIQLFGNEPKEMAEAAKIVARFAPDIIDVNMGCPVAKVVGNGEGSALLKDLGLVYEIVARMTDAVTIPITVKIRSGWDDKYINAPLAAMQIEKAGGKGLAVHARTRNQFYSGAADWAVIKDVVASVKIPVIGNGDIKSAADAQRMLEETGCAAVMVGRAAEGNPWLFAAITAFLSGGAAPALPCVKERFALITRHLSLLIEHKGESIALKEMRRHVGAYIKGLPHAAEFRALFNSVNDRATFTEVLEGYLTRLLQEG